MNVDAACEGLFGLVRRPASTNKTTCTQICTAFTTTHSELLMMESKEHPTAWTVLLCIVVRVCLNKCVPLSVAVIE